MCFSKLQNSVRKPSFLRAKKKKNDFRQKINIMTARLKEARVIPSKHNGVAVVKIKHLFWVEFYTKHVQLEMTIIYEVKKKKA